MADLPRLKSFLVNCGLVALGVTVSLLVAEVVLRIVGFSYPQFYERNDIVGSRLVAESKGWFRDEGESYVVINSAGLHDREHALAKPPGTIRIAVLGDSYAECFQLPIEDAFWSVLERKLSECAAFAGRPVEVINFGVSGYGTSQEYLTLQHFVWEYSPDIVLLAFLTLNDFNDNCRELADRPGILRPYFVLRGDGLELDTSFVGDPAYRSQKTRFLGSLRDWLAFHSRVHQLYDRARKILAAPQEKFMDSLERGRLGLFEGEYREPADSSWEHGWRITELLLLKMRDEVARHNARFLLVTLTNAIQVYPDSTIRRKFTDSRGITDLFYADHRLERFAHDHGIEVVTLAPIFQAYADRYKVYLHGFKNWKIGDGHWNRDGHELAGEVIASYICQKPVPPSKSSE